MKRCFSALLRRLQLFFRLLAGAAASRRIRQYAKPHAPLAVLLKLDHLGDVLVFLAQLRNYEEAMRRQHRLPLLLLDPGYCTLVRAYGFSGLIFPLSPNRFFADPKYAGRILHRLHRLPAESILNPVPQGYAELIASQLGGRASYTAYGLESRSMLTWLARLCSHYRMEQRIPLVRTESIYVNDARLMSRILLHPVPPEAAVLTDILAVTPVMEQRTERYYVIAPGSTDPRRIWPMEHWSKVIEILHRRFPGVRAVITGSRGEKPLADAILNALPPGVRHPEMDRTGQTTIMELAALLKHAEWVLGNDCGTLHLAALLQKPAVGTVGLGHWGCFFPNAQFYPSLRICHSSCPFANCSWRCRFADPVYRCLAAVPPETVADELSVLLLKRS